LKEQDLIERTMQGVPSSMKSMTKGLPTPISKTRSSVMARLNESHNMLRAYKGIDGKGIDVNDKLDLYEVYFTNIERVLYTQDSPGIVKPEVANTEPPQKAAEQEAEQQGEKPEGAATESPSKKVVARKSIGSKGAFITSMNTAASNT
jgi:hypothetical protein